MNRFIDRLKIFFLVVFAILTVGVWTVHIFWVWPGQRCEAKNMWWDWRTRVCALPVPLQAFTGRKTGEPREIVPAPQPVTPRPDA
jgi:hypothetical protein